MRATRNLIIFIRLYALHVCYVYIQIFRKRKIYIYTYESQSLAAIDGDGSCCPPWIGAPLRQRKGLSGVKFSASSLHTNFFDPARKRRRSTSSSSATCDEEVPEAVSPAARCRPSNGRRLSRSNCAESTREPSFKNIARYYYLLHAAPVSRDSRLEYRGARR